MASYTPPEIISLMGVVDTYLRYRNYKNSSNRKYFSFHPSEFGKCLRYQQYKHYAQLGYIKVKPILLDSQKIRLFDKGHNMHERWAKYYEEIGILRGRWKCANKSCLAFDDNGNFIFDKNDSLKDIIRSNKSRVYGSEELQGVFKPLECVCGCKNFIYLEIPLSSEEMNIKGSADLLLDFTNFHEEKFKEVNLAFNSKFFPKGVVVADMKTCNEWMFKNKISKEAHKEYIIQIIIYIHLLHCEYGILMYECKNNSNMIWYKVERNDEIFETIKWQAKIMLSMAENEKKQLPPPRPESKTCFECKSCDFSSICLKSNIWKDSNLNEKRQKFYRNLL
ncbi:MAG TPA: hypothetical protein VMZ91_06950 [Candidatus Paceibacterota bacterium]|nr:hypothetical protein [Candidatus Paceibacterota bacterium]